MGDTNEPSQTSPYVTRAVGELQHGFLHSVNAFIEAPQVSDSHGHGRINAFNALCVRCGKAVWIGTMLCLAAFSWVCAGAQTTGSSKQGAISQTEATEAEALRLNQIVGQLAREGRIDEAIPLARRSLKLSEQIHGRVHRNVSADLIVLANLYLAQGDYFNAEPLISRAIDIDKQLFGPRHPEVAIDIASLGNLFSKTGDYQAAIRSYREALDMLLTSPDARSYLEKTAIIHYWLGENLLELNQHNEAIAQYLSAEQIFELIDQKFAIRILIEMAEADRAHGKQPRAKEWLDRARQLEGD
jgi:tetratricopeptide (TPR) repeat protein